MWAASVSSYLSFSYAQPVHAFPAYSGSNFKQPKSLKLRASFSEYPLASKIMVRNIPYSINESSLHEKFSKFGQIAEVKLVKDEISKRSKGFAFVQYTSQDGAMLALESMDCQNLDGRVIYVELAKPTKDAYGAYPKASGPPKKPFMQKQEEVTDCWY